jgi:hypothetical protein
MNMGVDKSRKNGGVAKVMDFVTIRYFIGRNDCLYALVFDKDGGRTDFS